MPAVGQEWWWRASKQQTGMRRHARATQHDRSVVDVVVSRPTAALEPSKEKSRQGSDMDLGEIFCSGGAGV